MTKIIKPEAGLIVPENSKSTLLDSSPFLSRRQFLVKGSIFATAASVLCLGPNHKAFGLLMPSGQNDTDISPLLSEAIGFNGERIDPATGLYHLGQGYRTYNPALKRFHQFDSNASPFGRGGVNGYLYCFSNPVTFYDPTGRSPDWAAIGQGIAGLFIAIGSLALQIVTFGAATPVAVAGIVGGVGAVIGSTLSLASASLDDSNPHKENLSIAGSAFNIASVAAGAPSAVSSASTTASKAVTGVTTAFETIGDTLSLASSSIDDSNPNQQNLNYAASAFGLASAVGGTAGSAQGVAGSVGDGAAAVAKSSSDLMGSIAGLTGKALSTAGEYTGNEKLSIAGSGLSLGSSLLAKPEATPTRTKEPGIGLAGLEGYEYNTKERDMKFASDMLGFANGFVDDAFAAQELYGSIDAYLQDQQIRSAA